MTNIKYIQAFVDFRSRFSLSELGEILSEKIFAGIKFGGLDEGIWDEVPAMKLEREFLGLRVVLGGGGSTASFELEIEFADFPWDEADQKKAPNLICDISDFVKYKIGEIDGVDISQ